MAAAETATTGEARRDGGVPSRAGGPRGGSAGRRRAPLRSRQTRSAGRGADGRRGSATTVPPRLRPRYDHRDRPRTACAHVLLPACAAARPGGDGPPPSGRTGAPSGRHPSAARGGKVLTHGRPAAPPARQPLGRRAQKRRGRRRRRRRNRRRCQGPTTASALGQRAHTPPRARWRASRGMAVCRWNERGSPAAATRAPRGGERHPPAAYQRLPPFANHSRATRGPSVFLPSNPAQGVPARCAGGRVSGSGGKLNPRGDRRGRGG